MAYFSNVGGEIYVKKIPSMKVTDLAEVVAPNRKQEIVGIRPGEKLHEQMIGSEDAPYTYEYDDHFKILPAINSWSQDPVRINKGKIVPENFMYTSENNKDWMTKDQLKDWLNKNQSKVKLTLYEYYGKQEITDES